MKLLVTILMIGILTSCNPQVEAFNDQNPEPPVTEKPNPSENNKMKITIGDYTFTATLATSASAMQFKAMLPLTLKMSDFNNNEKVCSLPNSITVAASNPGTINTGDIMLYGSNSLVVFYESFTSSYSYTRIGQINNIRNLKEALGRSSVTIKFELE